MKLKKNKNQCAQKERKLCVVRGVQVAVVGTF